MFYFFVDMSTKIRCEPVIPVVQPSSDNHVVTRKALMGTQQKLQENVNQNLFTKGGNPTQLCYVKLG